MPKPPVKIPVIIDTREQRPWEFNSSEFVTDRGTLRTGDVSVKGLEDVIACERKSLGDFVSTVIHDWRRFRAELIRMSGFDHAVVVVEANLLDVLERRYEGDAAPAAVLGRANAIMIDHNIPVCWWGPRDGCVTMVERWLLQTVKKCGGVPE